VPDRDGKTAQLPSQKKIEGGKKKRRALFGTERVLNDDGKNDKTMALAQLKDPKDAKRFFVFFPSIFFSKQSQQRQLLFIIFVAAAQYTDTHF